MVEDIIVKCGRKRVSTKMIVITKASMNMERERKRRQEERMGKTILSDKAIFLSASEKNSSLLSAGRHS